MIKKMKTNVMWTIVLFIIGLALIIFYYKTNKED